MHLTRVQKVEEQGIERANKEWLFSRGIVNYRELETKQNLSHDQTSIRLG